MRTPYITCFFFQAEDGIRDIGVTGVQTCALPICRGTAWHTSWYTTPRFGNLYRGTGLIVDMGRPVTVTAVRVTLGPAAGTHFQIRVGNQPALAGMTPVAGSAGPGGGVRLAARTATPG